jgi:hypothetical protein
MSDCAPLAPERACGQRAALAPLANPRTITDARALLEAIDGWADRSARRQEEVAALRAPQRPQSRRISMT